ncbi:MAG: hypothetical protein JO013_14760 [Alphaproteobacteria bacterium]|nr:hypothetical protein [Alphaproteobacteria bacterium]
MGRYFSRLRPGLLGLLFAAMLLRLLVPAGFMFASDGHGSPTLVPCDGVAAAAPAHAMHGAHHVPPSHPAHRQQASCPYAALAAPVLPPLPAPLAAPPAVVPAPAPVAPRASVADRQESVRPPSTGPPHAA